MPHITVPTDRPPRRRPAALDGLPRVDVYRAGPGGDLVVQIGRHRIQGQPADVAAIIDEAHHQIHGEAGR